MSATTQKAGPSQRGRIWFEALTSGGQEVKNLPPSVQARDVQLGGQNVRVIAVVPDEKNHFPRARNGEVGLLEGWGVARAVREVVAADEGRAEKRPLIAIVDVRSQAYGRREEAFGIHQALAAAGAAYATARMKGHPVVALIVGVAMSGGFLAHGYQANRLIALDDPKVLVHAMYQAAAARITLRSVEDLEKLAQRIPPMAYDIGNYAKLGLLWKLLQVESADQPAKADVELIRSTLVAAVEDIHKSPRRDLSNRLGAPARQASAKVRELLKAQWA
jgi:malonate decarboxylase gamma subunit